MNLDWISEYNADMAFIIGDILAEIAEDLGDEGLSEELPL